ncbi:MAG: transcription antitermination factor NusB [Rickettsiella sp.]|nr:transcription antitermination factor NusB [Rickettsiella sp.]
MSKSKNNKFKAKQRARRFAMQAIYQWQLTQHSFLEIEKQFLSQEEMVSVDTDYFKILVHGVREQHVSLDKELMLFLDRPLKELDFVELAILRLAAFELSKKSELPYKVVLNEAIDLAKCFGATDGHKYINGILHQLAKKLRPLEFN